MPLILQWVPSFSNTSVTYGIPSLFFSRKMTPAETRYSTFDRELLAVYLSIKHFRHFLEGRTFHVLTDHKPLPHLCSELYTQSLLTQTSSSVRLHCSIHFHHLACTWYGQCCCRCSLKNRNQCSSIRSTSSSGLCGNGCHPIHRSSHPLTPVLTNIHSRRGSCPTC